MRDGTFVVHLTVISFFIFCDCIICVSNDLFIFCWKRGVFRENKVCANAFLVFSGPVCSVCCVCVCVNLEGK